MNDSLCSVLYFRKLVWMHSSPALIYQIVCVVDAPPGTVRRRACMPRCCYANYQPPPSSPRAAAHVSVLTPSRFTYRLSRQFLPLAALNIGMISASVAATIMAANRLLACAPGPQASCFLPFSCLWVARVTCRQATLRFRGDRFWDSE